MSLLDPRAPLRRLYRYGFRYRPQMRWAIFCSIMNKLCDLAPEILIGAAVDVVVRRDQSFLASLGLPDPVLQVGLLGVLTLLVWGGESLFQYLYQLAWRRLAQTMQHELRLDAFAHVQKLDMGFFEDRSTGSLVSILNDDINQLERFLDNGANQILQITTGCLGVGIVFFLLQPTIALLSMLPMPVIIIGSIWFQGRAEPLYAEVREKAGLISARLANSLTGIATIKSYTAEVRESEALGADSQNYRAANGEAIKLSSAFIPVVRMAVLSGFMVTLVYGGWLTLEDKLAVGAYSVLIFLSQRLLWPLTEMGATVDLYQRAMASTRRVLDLLDTQAPADDHGTPLALADVKGDVRFDAVSFAYAGRERVLEAVSAHIPAGTVAAFIGTTGSGKSTLAKLLMRFYEPSQGQVLLDGQPISSLRIRDLRRAISFVSQDVFLFDGTVGENIAYGAVGRAGWPTQGDIERAARLAEAHEFILGLPQGYDTLVGERGQKLSGGQRQRLSLARAILKDAPILVLDEATSAVDNETEAAIQRSLETIAVGRTTLVIAHRLTTIRHADQVFTVEDGRIVEVKGKAEWHGSAEA
ncbi:ABC transporter [Elstera litoralis]|uniref:ABC transporter n=1 Tax=Elstera litoralis TaxID=552518 RepID=A0A0F3IZL7_9PROT|nr:ABC transporter ATP-binding protein [Elstera litoralis]KJV11044.1 ABC transporter [Elstera litoralis]